MLAQQGFDCGVIAIADPQLLRERARALALPLDILPPDPLPAPPGALRVLPVTLARPAIPVSPSRAASAGETSPVVMKRSCSPACSS